MMSQEYGPVFHIAFGGVIPFVRQMKFSGLGNTNF